MKTGFGQPAPTANTNGDFIFFANPEEKLRE